MESMPATDGLLAILQNAPNWEAAYDFCEKAINYYKKVYRKQTRHHKPVEVLFAFYKLVEDNIQKTDPAILKGISCRKGCAYCCNVNVAVSLVEVRLILAYCKENKIDIDTEYLKKQAAYPEEFFHRQEHTACVFLGPDNACRVYEVRPFACRKYLVVSPPERCDAKKYEKGGVVRVLDTPNECIASAFIENPVLNMPKALLKELT